MLGFRPRDPGPQVKNAPLGVRSSPMGPGPPGGDVQRAKRQRTITNSRPEQHLGITWGNKLRPPRRSEPGATRMKADLWLPVRIAMRPWLGVDPGHADGAPRPTATAVVELAGAMARTARHRSESRTSTGRTCRSSNACRGGLQGNHHSSRPAGRLQFGCGFLRRFAVLPDYDNALIYPNSRK